MNLIKVNKSSSLYKVFQFLSDVPGFSLFIKNDYEKRRISPEDFDYVRQVNSFNDICTFTRHVFFSLAMIVIYLIIFALGINFLFIEPIKSLLGTVTTAGQLTLTFYGVAVATYVILLIVQHATVGMDKVVNYFSSRAEESQEDYVEEKEPVIKQPGFFASLFKLLSEKHANFCKRVVVEDDTK